MTTILSTLLTRKAAVRGTCAGGSCPIQPASWGRLQNRRKRRPTSQQHGIQQLRHLSYLDLSDHRKDEPSRQSQVKASPSSAFCGDCVTVAAQSSSQGNSIYSNLYKRTTFQHRPLRTTSNGYRSYTSSSMVSGLSTNHKNTNERSSSRPTSDNDTDTSPADCRSPPSSLSSSVYFDSNQPWEEWVSGVEYETVNPWDTVAFPPLDHVALDNESRFLLQLLQDMYQITLARRQDRLSTERCNAMIAKLSGSSSSSSVSSSLVGGGTNTIEGRHDKRPNHRSTMTTSSSSVSYATTNSQQLELRAHRAHVILQAMEAFLPLHAQCHTKQLLLPVPLPIPNHETYWSVLKLHANKYLHGSRDIPLRCQAIVERMQRLSSSTKSNNPNVPQQEFRPSVLHWNLVLAAWANSQDQQRPVEAAQLLYQLHSQTSSSDSGSALTDASSFSHTLRACSSLTQRGQVATPEFAMLAREVAVRVWTALLREQEPSPSPPRLLPKNSSGGEPQASSSSSTSIVALNSFLHVHFLRACRNFPSDDPRRDRVVGQTFRECCQRGKVNPHVLQEFMTVASLSLQHELLGPYFNPTATAKGGTYNEYQDQDGNQQQQPKHQRKNMRMDPLVLIRKVPSAWVEHADGNKFSW
jgi:hypothetical protein